MSQNTASAASDQRLTNHPEEQAVRVPLENYMRGHAADNPEFMCKAFMTTAHIESVREGPLTSCCSRPKPAGRLPTRPFTSSLTDTKQAAPRCAAPIP